MSAGKRAWLIFWIMVVTGLVSCGPQPKANLGATAAPTSPYVALLDSLVRGLTAEEITELETGAGAGFARAAELNGYPGPRHILDLKDQLGLSQDQLAQVQALYEAMNGQARQSGAEILQLEADLELAFRNQSIDAASLDAKVKGLAEKYGKLRLLHLDTHLKAIKLLTEGQIAKYNQLRGYGEQSPMDHSSGHHP